ncbi:hypothetical protein [Synechococcus sp. M16CYN]|uniref:DUF7734 family protein n=1 Tax=Synechococcus sp. M16CYN TaxID=3103139 RepID=UPI00324F7FD4
MTDVELINRLEERSRSHSDRVVRIVGVVGMDAFELLIFRGFSSSTTHATALDPDVSVLPEGTILKNAELLWGPMRPGEECVLIKTASPAELLAQANW